VAKDGDEELGGARGSRTPDLLNAIQALSQLSYGPSRAGIRSQESVIRRREKSD
jgi:hypothetical protein